MAVELFTNKKQKERDGIKSPRDRVASIVSELEQEVAGEVDSDFCRDLQMLSSEVRKKGVLHCHSSEEEKYAFGRQSCWVYASTYLDHHFHQAMEFCQLLVGDEITLRHPSQQLKSDYSFDYWHQRVEENVKKLTSAGLSVVAKKLDIIRLISSCMNTTSIEGEIYYCRYCFRRVPTKNNCRYHMAVGDDFYLEVKKPSSFLKENGWKWILRQRGIRGIIGEYPFNHSYFREAGEIPKLIHQGNWSFTSELLQKLFDTELNYLRGFLVIKMFKQQNQALFPLNTNFSSYPAFVRWLYSKEIMDNPYEDSLSAFWLMNALFAANERLKAEKKLTEHTDQLKQATEERNVKIFQRRAEGASYRKIAASLDISKSLVCKVLSSRN
ncbi:hypothetical protein [Paraglaciecola arctica]|uniref:hypothetical protein n=1 Tax=Paraglaciecola arctica TaxID=1128911 RepID=UPI001C0704B6|nr:hypothetical protein [Paraglaciecola arctica]MBU3004285.1 hypothetical protein [Paraglaciecola arctica]